MDLLSIRNLLAQGLKIFDLPLKVTYYARVSTDREEQLNSLNNQTDYFEDFIKKNTKWTFVTGYIDEGISGKSVKKRVHFLEMIEDAKKGKFNLILTKEISRFSRNTVDSIEYTQELLSYSVGVYFLNDNINTFESDSEFRLTLMASMAQDELRRLSERVRFGIKRSIAKGIVIGNNSIYGYKKDHGKLVIDDETAKIVKLIFSEYAKGKLGTRRLSHYLYEKYNVKSSTGKPLGNHTIGRIIQNPKYKGYYCGNKTTTLDYKNTKVIENKKEDWVLYKDYDKCPPIVSEELWNKCNKIFNKNSENLKNNKRTDLRYGLSGKIKCYHDGATFVRGNYKNKKTGEVKKFFGCSNYRMYGRAKKNGCQTPVIRFDELGEVFKTILNYIFDNKSSIFDDIYRLVNESKNKQDFRKEISKIDKEIINLNNLKKELINMRARKEINFEEYTGMKESYDEELFRLNKEIKQYEEKDKSEKLNSNINKFKKTLNNLIFKDNESIFNIIDSIVDTILVEKDSECNKKRCGKVILHIKLNILSSESTTLNLDDFLLLFGSHDRFI